MSSTRWAASRQCLRTGRLRHSAGRLGTLQARVQVDLATQEVEGSGAPHASNVSQQGASWSHPHSRTRPIKAPPSLRRQLPSPPVVRGAGEP